MALTTRPGDEGNNDLLGLVEQALVPSRVTPALVSRALNRARRLGLYWKILAPLERALLWAAARARVSEYRSPRVRELLAKLIARIEAQTPRGLALAAGLAYALSRRLLPQLPSPARVLGVLREKLQYILYLGKNALITRNYFSPLISGA